MADPVKAAGTHYELLGVPTGASAEAIKRAYYRRVREFPPERDPDGFRRLREAWETLRDPQARREYDLFLDHGGELGRLTEESGQLLEAGDMAGAQRVLRRLLALWPECEAARARLAFAHAHAGEFGPAVRQFDRLCRTPTGQYLVWAADARVRWSWEESLEANRVTRLRHEAEKLYLQAIRTEPLNAQPYLGLARLARWAERFDQALDWVEKAIAADGVVDFQDFEALQLACTIHAEVADDVALERTVHRIQKLAEVPEQLEYAAWHLGRSAWIEAHRNLRVPVARSLARAAERLCPGDADYRRQAAFYEDLLAMQAELYQVQDLPLVAGLVGMAVALHLAPEEMREDLAARGNQLLEAMDGVPGRTVLAWLERMARQCPVFCRRHPDVLARVRDSAQQRARVESRLEAASRDRRLSPALQDVLGWLGEADDPSTWTATRERLEEAVARQPRKEIITGVNLLRREYPEVVARWPNLTPHLEALAGTRATSEVDWGGGCGCLILLGLGFLGSMLSGG